MAGDTGTKVPLDVGTQSSHNNISERKSEGSKSDFHHVFPTTEGI